MKPVAAALVLGLTAGPALAADSLDGAQAFVEGLYRAYQGHENDTRGPDYLGRDRNRTFAPALAALIARDAANAKGEVGTLDGDPICNCQDYAISKVQVTITNGPGNTAAANVSFTNLREPQVVRLDLVKLKAGWRVADVHAEGAPSLIGLLKSAR